MSRKHTWTDEEFLQAISSSKSHRQASIKLGYNASLSIKNHAHQYTKFFNRLKPDISHFSLRSRGNSLSHSENVHAKEHEAELLYTRYINSAKQTNKLFSLNRQDFVRLVTSNCFYCGSDGEQKNTGRRKSVHKICGLDRINSDIGYILDNVVPCCWQCNNWKKAMKQIDFLNHVRDIARHMGM